MTLKELVQHFHSLISGWGANGTTGEALVYAQQLQPGGITTNSQGEGQPFNIVQPYQVVGYMWIRAE